MSIVQEKIPIFDRELVEERDYWLQKLAIERGESGLKADRPRPELYSSERDYVGVRLHGEVTERLSKITGDSSFLLYTALATALKICLHKYTGSSSIIVGSPVRRREDDADVKPNVLAMSDAIDGGMTVRQLLVNVRETLLEGYARQRYPFDRLVKELGIERHENRNALFDVALALEDFHLEMPEVKNDLTAVFQKSGKDIDGRVEYDGRLFRRETIERFVTHFTNLLNASLRDVNARIGELEMLDEDERRQLLVEWNDTQKHYSSGDLCAHQIFEARATETPEAIALIYREEELSYRELNERANQLAQRLLALDIGPETVVAICMERSIEMIVSMLAVLKAGGAYLPLDPSYPSERLAFMLGDARPKILLTKESLVEQLPKCDARIIRVDTEWESISALSSDNPAPALSPDNLAYLIYTSGSTGRPKAVLLSHRGLSNLALSQAAAFAVSPLSRVLQFASPSFDASVSEVFMALTSGAALSLGTADSLFSASNLLELLRHQRITTVTLPPALLSVLPDADLPELSVLIAAGESCPPEVLQRWGAGRRFFNAYGPTETTVCATLGECDAESTQIPPIGRPLANMRVYVLDNEMGVVAAGVTGELYVSGVGLARGYMNE
ncbi:MAG TPA: amino acid adenylation domain-containing protein, partial [Pyrinomonadaceae bacterium]